MLPSTNYHSVLPTRKSDSGISQKEHLNGGTANSCFTEDLKRKGISLPMYRSAFDNSSNIVLPFTY